MNIQEAKKILGNKAKWELKNMYRALTSFEVLNTPKENKRLEAVKILLRK